MDDMKSIIDTALVIVAASGKKAIVRAARSGLAGFLGSLLGDLEDVSGEVHGRTKRAREKLERIPR